VVVILAMMTVADKVGAGPFNGLLVTAGVITSMLLDHYGVLKRHPSCSQCGA